MARKPVIVGLDGIMWSEETLITSTLNSLWREGLWGVPNKLDTVVYNNM